MSEPVIEMTPDQTMYRVSLKEDGFEVASYVSSMHLVDEKVKYLREKIREEARKVYLRNFDDI